MVRHLKELIDEGLLISSKSKLFGSYEITPKGQRYLKVFAEMEDDTQPFVTAKIVSGSPDVQESLFLHIVYPLHF